MKDREFIQKSFGSKRVHHVYVDGSLRIVWQKLSLQNNFVCSYLVQSLSPACKFVAVYSQDNLNLAVMNEAHQLMDSLLLKIPDPCIPIVLMNEQ